jgi:hypothetical protein
MLDTKEIEFYDVYHLPIIKAYADKIDLVNTINRLVPTKMEIDPGTLSLAMVMDARVPGCLLSLAEFNARLHYRT